MLSCNHKNAELSKCVLSLTLKTSTDVVRLTSKGKALKSLGAAQVKDLSPSVALDIKRG